MRRIARTCLRLAPLLILACGNDRVDTRLELSLLGLDLEATRLVFSVQKEVDRVSETRQVVDPQRAVAVFEAVAVVPRLSVSVEVFRGETLVQAGHVQGETHAGRAARWSVTLAPAGAPQNVCDGLDNNENGEIDEIGCSG